MLNYFLEVGSLGCILFTVLLLMMAYSGVAGTVRDEEGYFKKEISIVSIFGVIFFVIFLIGFLTYAGFEYLQYATADPSLWHLWTIIFGIFFVIHLYDLIIIDYLLIVKWHPDFLHLPDTDYYRNLKPHLIGFFRGIPIGLLASLISAYLVQWIN